MVCRMKVTFDLDEDTVIRLREEAARQGRTMSDLVEDALRQLLRPGDERVRLSPLPTFHGGRELVDVADREALCRAMEEG
jgi:plasmid stability protein